MNSSYDAIGNSPEPSAARTRGRLTGTRRPPRVTDPRSRPCRTAVRASSCLPFGPASTVTSASISAAMTCRPAPTARASRPSCRFSAISVIATLTRSGIAGALALSCGLVAIVEVAAPRTTEAIVLAPSADGRSSPAADGTVLFTVHEGLKVEVRGERPGWIQIGVPNGLAGWIESSQAERI